MQKRLVTLVLIMAVLLSASLVGCKKNGNENKVLQFNSVNVSATPTPMNAEDDKSLIDNPDRGYRTEFVVFLEKKMPADGKTVPRTVYVDQDEADIRQRIQSIFDIYIYSKTEQPKLSLAYIYLTNWRREEISEELLRFFEIYFTMCREQKIKNMLRVSYCDSYLELDRGADQQTILRHIKQLKPVISEYADAIHTIECGFVGAYGEWAEVYQHPAVDYATVIKAITEELAVPNNLYFSIRDPRYKNLVGKDYEHYWSISYNCDAMFGYQDSWCSDGYLPSTDRWAQVEREGAYTPQGGEMFTNDAMFNNNTIPVGWEMILQCYYHRQTSMSSWHGFTEAYWKDNVMQRWIDNEKVTAARLDSKGIIYDPNWFLDDSGEAVHRNPYEFIRDHLGYRISVDSATLNWSGSTKDKIRVDMSLKNYGFSAAFNLESGFAILDENNTVISEVKAGEPKTWYNRDPDDAYSLNILTHNISAELEPVREKGKYKLAFYLRNTMGTYAGIANRVDFVNGYNILSEFEIK